MQRQYSGATTRSIVYANPTGTQQNNTLAYTYTESVNILQAAASTGAAFDVHSTYAYTITQDPGVGSVPVSETSDVYENLVIDGNTQYTSTVGQSITTVDNDETANALGGGPYTATTVTQSSYPTPLPGNTFPLQAGASYSVPLGASIATTYTDFNAAGSAPPNNVGVSYSSQETENNDGSLQTQTSRANGTSTNIAVNSDGSGSIAYSSGTTAYTTSIGVPVSSSSGYSIPVTQVFTAPSSNTKSYAAADWYPGNAAVPAPLASQTRTVIGAVSSLPAECNGALTQPDTFEVDMTQTALLSTGSYLTSTTRAFNSNGVAVCSLTQRVQTSYDIYTGALLQTTTTQTTQILTALSN